MKRFWCNIIFFLVIMVSLNAEEFEKYDFTFYKTVDDSIAIMNEERFGFDYTGYGFLGQNMTTGLYIRFGMQTPYSTLVSIFEKEEDNQPEENTPHLPDEITPIVPDINIEENENTIFVEPRIVSNQIAAKSKESTDNDSPTTEDSPKSKYEKEFIFSFTIGPAFRHFISESVMWYMGMGVTSIVKDITKSSASDNSLLTSLEIKLGTDFDMGFRLDLKEDTSLRIGVHITTGLLTYSNTSISGGDITQQKTTNKLIADIFTPIGAESSTNVNGYIGLAHVFKPKDVIHYRYSNKTTKLGGGQLVKM